MELKERSAIVTGGGSGLGKDISIKLAEAGTSVAVIFNSNEDAANATVEEIHKANPDAKAFALRADVSKVDDVKNMIAHTVTTFGRLDILVNNAGIRIIGSLTDTSEEDWGRTIAVNLSGVFYCCKYAVPEMVKQSKGKIVNIASIAALSGFVDRVAYSASKGGVIALNRSLALELGPQNIYVNAICPGFVLTPLTAPYENDPKMLNFVKQSTLLGRWGKGEEIGDAVLYLASDRSDFVTGIALTVDGGFMAGKK